MQGHFASTALVYTDMASPLQAQQCMRPSQQAATAPSW